jgi:drug/metabolite transporter (DMT)-like permease
MRHTYLQFPTGVIYALLAAVFFGASTPFAKLFIQDHINPFLMAGILYLGSGCGLFLWRLLVRDRIGNASEASLTISDYPWLLGAIFFGGVLGPVLLMIGLTTTPGSTASLLLNVEGVLTAVLAWFVFKENFDRRIAWGMVAITAGSVILSWDARLESGLAWGTLSIFGACLAWAIDNNLTRKVSAGDPVQIAMMKGLVAGSVNVVLALINGSSLPDVQTIAACGTIGFFGYGVSLTLFVLALRSLGTARTGAYFSIAPFIGASISFLFFSETVTINFLIATAFIAWGVWLHLTEQHCHEHEHEEMYHDHRHVHDEHHQHEHDLGVSLKEPHSHPHHHKAMRHRHPHYPDIHHRHDHDE